MSDKSLILSNKKGVQDLILAAYHFGVKHVIISPGSRNAPLTVSFHRSGFFTCHSLVDERSAAFFGLGIALQSGQPVIILCTSGSAAANFAPALVEAYYLRAPLIAVTADRPLSWTDQGNGQTIRQEGLYANFIRFWFSLISEPANHEEEWENRRKLSTAFNTALRNDPGPVQINVPLFEPLYKTAEVKIETSPRFYTSHNNFQKVSESVLDALSSAIKNSKKVMILAGQMRRNEKLEKILTKLSEYPNIVILTETTANINLPDAIDSIDRIIMPLANEKEIENLMPDVLVTLGGYVVTKKLKALLRKFQPDAHWHIHPHDSGLDTYMSLTHEVHAEAGEVLLEITRRLDKKIETNYRNTWIELKEKAQIGHEGYIQSTPYSDFSVFAFLYSEISKRQATLHMGNSTPVRYIQLLGFRSQLEYHGNRGTSGIDGCTSTAAGWAAANPSRQVLLITGDTSFVYDSNGLWNKSLPQNLKIIVINNQGGGIFRIIEGPDSTDEMETFFEAHHPVDLKKLSEAFHVEHYQANDMKLLASVTPEFLEAEGCAILEVITPGKENPNTLKEYFSFIRKSMGELKIRL